MIPPQQAVVLCGGLGTRLRPYTDSMPKPMIPVNGRPFLEFLLRQCAEQGIRRFLLLTGYLGERIHDYFGDGSLWGWQVEYSHGPVEWDTGRRVWEGKRLMARRFLLLYSDNICQFSLDALWPLHLSTQAAISFLLAPKKKGNIRVSANACVEAYDKTRTGTNLDFVEIGYMIVERDRVLRVFPEISNHPDFSFSEVIRRLVDSREIAGLIVRDPYHSVSDPERLERTRLYLEPKRILLIDRDGVINKKAPKGEYVRTWAGFEWVEDTRRAMKDLASRGYKFIVITNQAGVARGKIEPADLDQIHENMVKELRVDGVEVLQVYTCPHHWDESCDCRKPAPGLFFRASNDHLLRMDRTIYAGDDPRDYLAAHNAGCMSVFLGQELGEEAASNIQPSLRAATLTEAIPWIERRFNSWVDEMPVLPGTAAP